MMLILAEHWNKITHLAVLAAVFSVLCVAQVWGADSGKSAAGLTQAPEDPYLWLEEVTGER
ncbi:MAG TPA: hypothetical protein VNZ22_13570, partial [Bacillota bacterium]|nr:hypothetical protein [Bacillota bacterium]